jgi:uncharacterized membrane protein (DUF4010 family)
VNPLTLSIEVAGNLCVAALAGLAVGIEREWSGHASGPSARFAGARTFLLLGLIGGIAGWLSGGGLIVLATVLLAPAAILVAAAYALAARRSPADIDGTTEVAALVVLALGTVAGLGFPLFTSAAVSVVVLVLVEKSRIHHLVHRIGEREMAATLQFAVLALVVLPLVPTGPYGPYDSIRPRSLWVAVLLFSGLSYAGYLARHAVGAARGYGLTGLLGGIISSTAVVLGFARRSRAEPSLSGALALGAVGACVVVVFRVLVLSCVLNPGVARASIALLWAPLVVGGGVVAIALLRQRPGGPDDTDTIVAQSPLGLWSAIKLAAALQIVLTTIPFVQQRWGGSGVLASSVVVGISDMDALTLAMTRAAGTTTTAAFAARAIAVGIFASTLFKLAVAVAFGSGAFRRYAGLGLAALAAIVGAALWLAA